MTLPDPRPPVAPGRRSEPPPGSPGASCSGGATAQTRPDPPLPSHSDILTDGNAYPLALGTGRTLTQFHAFYDHGQALPLLEKRDPGGILWLSPTDAMARGLGDGDAVGGEGRVVHGHVPRRQLRLLLRLVGPEEVLEATHDGRVAAEALERGTLLLELGRLLARRLLLVLQALQLHHIPQVLVVLQFIHRSTRYFLEFLLGRLDPELLSIPTSCR
mgnify:CR=1 FL=1